MKKVMMMFVGLMMATTMVQAQSATKQQDVVYDVCEEMPQYPGGMGEMMKFLMDNVRYPQEAEKQKLEGRVIVKFVVEKDGQLTEFSVPSPCHPLLDQEALRVVKSMPRWTPGKNEGKPVRVSFFLPVMFRLK